MHLKTHFHLFLRLQSSNDVCTQSGLVIFSCTSRRAPLLLHISYIDSTCSPFDIQLLEAQNYHLLKGRMDADVEYSGDGRDGRIGATKYAGGKRNTERGGKAERITQG